MIAKNDHIRVALVVGSLQFGGGAERLVVDIFNELNRIEIPVILIACERTSSKNDAELIFERQFENHSQVFFLKDGIRFSLKGKSKLTSDHYERIINEFRPTVIHSNLFISEMIAHGKMRKEVTYISHFHDNMIQFMKLGAKSLLNKRKLTDYFEKKYLLKQYKKSNWKAIAISKNGVQYLQNHLPSSFFNQIVFLPNGVNTSRFSQSKKELSSPIKLLSIGSFDSNKNQQFLVQVIELLVKEGINVHADFLGEGPTRKSLMKLVHDKNLDQRISFHGNQTIEPYISSAHLLIHAALSEAFGLALVEAMAGGLPVICLDGKGNRDLIQQGENGYLISEQNIEEFKNRVLLAMHPNHYEKMSESARRFAQQFDIINYVQSLLKLYQS